MDERDMSGRETERERKKKNAYPLIIEFVTTGHCLISYPSIFFFFLKKCQDFVLEGARTWACV